MYAGRYEARDPAGAGLAWSPATMRRPNLRSYAGRSDPAPARPGGGGKARGGQPPGRGRRESVARRPAVTGHEQAEPFAEGGALDDALLDLRGGHIGAVLGVAARLSFAEGAG